MDQTLFFTAKHQAIMIGMLQQQCLSHKEGCQSSRVSSLPTGAVQSGKMFGDQGHACHGAGHVVYVVGLAAVASLGCRCGCVPAGDRWLQGVPGQ